MDKKGSTLALGLLPWFALAACIAVLFTFFQYDSHMSKSMQDTSTVLQTLDFNEQYVLSAAQTALIAAKQTSVTKESFAKAAESYNAHLAGQGNFFLLLSEGRFTIDQQGKTYILMIPGLYTGADSSNLKIIRPLGPGLVFDDSGRFIRFINK